MILAAAGKEADIPYRVSQQVAGQQWHTITLLQNLEKKDSI